MKFIHAKTILVAVFLATTSVRPTIATSEAPTLPPTLSPSPAPTPSPTPLPTLAPSFEPTASPTLPPTLPPTPLPTLVPSLQPTALPTLPPTLPPTPLPTLVPSLQPTALPTLLPTLSPTPPPTLVPSLEPTALPTSTPTPLPTLPPSPAPTLSPTSTPTPLPTLVPSPQPTALPTLPPTPLPTLPPSPAPTLSPTSTPTPLPTLVPSLEPTALPTSTPTPLPTLPPSPAPTLSPTSTPTPLPTLVPSPQPTTPPTLPPTSLPTLPPSPAPTLSPTSTPTPLPTLVPSLEPTALPTSTPTPLPTLPPSPAPTLSPTSTPTPLPTLVPSPQPTALPTLPPTPLPTLPPSPAPTLSPTSTPTPLPTLVPSLEPTTLPTSTPTPLPTLLPSPAPTLSPTSTPTPLPTLVPSPKPTALPTLPPTPLPTLLPSFAPTLSPTPTPTPLPSPVPTPQPTPSPSPQPSPLPTPSPSLSRQPTSSPTQLPTVSYAPTPLPTLLPTPTPTPVPTEAPEIINVTLPAGFTGLPTRGGSTVTLTGEDFGSSERFDGADNNPSAEALKVTYGATGTEYEALNCSMTVEHKKIVCVTAPGVGTNLRFRVQHTGVASKLSAGTISYLAPHVSGVQADYGVADPTGFGTAGGEAVTLTGANFGPSGTHVEAFYQLPVGQGFNGGTTLQGSRFLATGCVLAVPHTKVVCNSSAGVGSGHVWFLNAGNQTGAAPLNATTRYASPRFASLERADENKTGLSMGLLDTRGGDNVTLRGANFGPVASNNAVSSSYQIANLSTEARAELGLAGEALAALRCAVTVAHEEVTCTTIQGVGAGHLWGITVGGQAQDDAATSSSSLNLTSSYAPPAPVSWKYPSTAAALDTKGGQVVTAVGDFFGPLGATTVVTAVYRSNDASLAGFASGPFAALSCNVTVAHTELSCRTEVGVGSGHAWNFVAGGQAEASGTALLVSSYRPPALTSVVADTASGLFSTAGGEWATVTGFNFGPPSSSVPSNAATATYANPSLQGRGLDLVGDTFTATDCEVLSFESARCKSVQGLGYGQSWRLTIGGQTWPQAGLNASFVGQGASNATRVQTSYHPPTLESFQGPHGVVSSSDGWPPVLLLAAGGEAVVLNGSNFGPAGLSASFYVHYSNPSLSGLAGSTFAAEACSVTIAHEQITCLSTVGVGTNHTWYLSVGNQTLTPDSEPAATSYRAPEITGLDLSAQSEGMNTKGTSKVTVTGVNFGPTGAASNAVRAAYASVLPGLNPNTFAGATYEVLCTVTTADVEAECETKVGVGRAHAWVLFVGGQESAPSEDRTHYQAPVATTLTILGGGGATTLSTAGGQGVVLSGSNFGPAGDPANAVSAVYRTLPSELELSGGLGPAVVVGQSMETTDYAATSCNVTRTDTEITCWTSAGVGRHLRFLATVGLQVTNASTGTLSYTAPLVTAIDCAGGGSCVRALDPSDGVTVTALEFGTRGGNVVTVTGANFGPVDGANSISVQLSNPTLGLQEGLDNDGFGSALAAGFGLASCAVTVADVEAECTVPPSVGRKHEWAITVGSQESPAAANFTSSFTPPTLTGLTVVSAAASGDGGFDTLGGADVVQLTGDNLGPSSLPGFGSNAVYGATLSSTCERCASSPLVHSVAGQAGLHANRTSYNFLALSCRVSVNHTTMRCVVGAGVGKNHTWQAFVGGQPSNPLVSVQTGYANPDLEKLNPVVGSIVAEEASGEAVTVTLHGRHFGSPLLCTPTVYLHVREESLAVTGGGFAYSYSSVRLNVSTPLNHSDGALAFRLPSLAGAQVLTDESQTAYLSVEVAGVETRTDARLPFRYFEVQNVAPFSAPLSLDPTCVTSPNVTVHGTGFVTDQEYASTFFAVHHGAALDGKPPGAVLQLGNKELSCEVTSSKALNCPNTPGYSGPEAVAFDGAVTLTPQVSLTAGEEWMTSCGSPVPTHLATFPSQPTFPAQAGCTFAYYSLPDVTGISPATGPLAGNTTVRVEGEYFEGNSGLMFAVFGVEGQAEYVECALESGTVALCPSPAFLGTPSALFGGALVEVRVQLDREYVERRTCLLGAGANSSFYYHPDALTSDGPFPPLLSLEGAAAQSLLVDATPFFDEGLLSVAQDFDPALDLFRVSTGEASSTSVVSATREEHRAVNVSFLGHLDSLPLDRGDSLLIQVVVDTAFEVGQGLMASDCRDINLWLPDQSTTLHYWLKPGTCGDVDTTLVVRLPGPLRVSSSSGGSDDFTGLTLDSVLNLELFASFGSSVASEFMNGEKVFSLSDGHTTHAGGPTYSTEAWRYPGSASGGGLAQQQVDDYRYRAKYVAVDDTDDGGYTQHQYKGNWSYLVMTETLASFHPTMRVDVGWEAPLASRGSDYVLYFSEKGSAPYVPQADGWVADSTLFVTIGTGPAGGSEVRDSVGPELRVWGADPSSRVFSNGSFCGEVVAAAGPRWPSLVAGVEAAFTLNGGDLGDASGSTLSVRYKLAGTLLDWQQPSSSSSSSSNATATIANTTVVDYGWVSCAPIAGFGQRVWGAGGSDSFRFPFGDGGSKAQVQEAADTEAASAGTGWSFSELPELKVHVGVDQRSNTSTLGSLAYASDTQGWANAHAWLTVVTADDDGGGLLSRPSGTVDAGNREWWRLRFSTDSRPASTQAHDLAASFNGQGGLSSDSTATPEQFTSSLAQGHSYDPPPEGGVWPDLLDLTSYDMRDYGGGSGDSGGLNLTVWSPAISAAVAALVASGEATSGQLSWKDLPLNLNAFPDASVASPGLSLEASAAVDIRLAVGSFEGAPCVPAFTADIGAMGSGVGAGEVAVQCSLAGARKGQLMDSSAHGSSLVRVSFNGGVTYDRLPGANLTVYSIGANFTSHLVGSMYGGTQIAGAVAVEAAGANKHFALGNSSLVLLGLTSGAELVLPLNAPGGEAQISAFRDSNGVDNAWRSLSPQGLTQFNVTVPHSEGVLARDVPGPAPTPSPTLLNATKPPTPVPLPGCSDDNSFADSATTKCPSDSALNCSFCPSNRLREGAWYPCYRPSALSGHAGRCLPERGSSVRFSADESVSLSVRTAFTANGYATTTGQHGVNAIASASSHNGWVERSGFLVASSGQTEFDTGHSLSTYDPATLIEEMDPLGAASIRRASDAATAITFSGKDLRTAMAPEMLLTYSSGAIKGSFEDKGSAVKLVGELAGSNGYYPRVPSEFPRKSDLTVDESAESTLLLRQPTRLQSVYLASELTEAHFNAGDRFTSAYFKVSGTLRGNLYNVRVRLGLTNRTQVAAKASVPYSLLELEQAGGAAEKGSALLVPVHDEELALVCGPTSLSVGDVDASEGLKDAEDFGQWVRLVFDVTDFEWDGSSNLVVDLGYAITPWGQGVKSATYLSTAGPAANLLLRATYGKPRTAVTLGAPSNNPKMYEFVPFLQLGTDSQVVLKHAFRAEFPGGVSSAALSMGVDITVNGQAQAFLGAETSRLVPGAVMYLNISSDPATVALLENDPNAQADLKSVLASSLASAQSKLTADNVVLTNIGFASSPNYDDSGSRRNRRQLLSAGASTSTTVEIKAVSSDAFTLSDASASSLHSQLESSASDGTLASSLAATPSMAGKVFATQASPTLSLVAGNNATQDNLFSGGGGGAGFVLFNPRTITVGPLDPALSSVEGGTVVTISGSGFFTPTTSNGLAVVRWTVLNSDVWLTSYGTVGKCAADGSECEEIYTTTPAADESFVADGTTRVYAVVSFNGVSFSSVSFISYLVYYKSPRMNSFYMLDKYPTTIPHATQQLLGASEYRKTSLMPQSGKQFNVALNREVQLFLYVNASDLYLTSSTTVCVFLFDGTGDDSLDVFEGCVDENRCVLSDADLVYSEEAFESAPGFEYILGANFYGHVEFACEVPPTDAGPVRVALSANGFSGNELAADPTGAFLDSQGLILTSFGCSPGEYASSPNIACRACPPGKMAETDGTACSECPRRTYQPIEGSVACLECPLNTDTNTTGADSASQCVCVEGYYTLNGKGGFECDACVGNAVCPGGRAPPYPVEGYFRQVSNSLTSSSSSSGTGSKRALLQTQDQAYYELKLESCSPPTACIGGPENACKDGYQDEECSVCEEGYFRLSHYCTECPDPTLVSFILPVQLLMFTFALLALTLAFDTVSRYATMSIFVRFAQLLFVTSYYEVAWSGSFDHYYRHSKGVLINVENDVYPISFFSIFKVLNYFGPLVYFPLFQSTSAPGCPNDRHVDWMGVVDGFFHSDYFSLDSLGGWVIVAVVALELVCHGRSSRVLRVQQRVVAIVCTCLPAGAMYVVRYVICDLGSSSAGTCVANTAESQSVLFILVGGFTFVCSTFYGIASAEAGTSKANTGPFCFLTRNKKTKFAGHEAWLQLRSVLLVAVTVVTPNGVFQAGLSLCMLLVSLIFQVLYHPFLNTKANTLEAISTAALVVVSFVGMVGSIGQLDMHLIADSMKYAGYGLVLCTTVLALYVIASEVREARSIASKEARYVRVSLGLQQPSVAELEKEQKMESLVGFVREIVQAMLQGDMAGNSGIRGVGACPFPDEQISQLLNSSELLYSVTMMRHTMFRSFVLGETKGFFRRIVTHPEVSHALEVAMERKNKLSTSFDLGPKSKKRFAAGGAMEAVSSASASVKHPNVLAKFLGNGSSGTGHSKVATTKVAVRTTHSLRTVLFRLIDKVSRYLTQRMLEPPPVLLALKGTAAYSEWGAKTGDAKVPQEMWNRVHKLFKRRLEPFPMAVRRALHCADEESFGSHYIQPWMALLGPIAETALDTWFTVSGAGSGREVKAKMLDCMFDPEQKVAFTVETLQHLRSLLVTEPSTQHSYVVGVLKKKSGGLLAKLSGGGGGGGGGLDDLKTVRGGHIVEMRIELSNCYRDRTDPKMGQDGWSVRLLRDREMRARKVKQGAISQAKPLVLHDDCFQATMNGGSAKHAKLFNVRAEGWNCHPSTTDSGALTAAPSLQVDLGRITRIAALSFQGGSIYALAPVHSKPVEVPKEASCAIQAAVDALKKQLAVVRESVFKAKPKAEQKKLKEDAAASKALESSGGGGGGGEEEEKRPDGGKDEEKSLALDYEALVPDSELPNGYRQAAGEAKVLSFAIAAIEGSSSDDSNNTTTRSNTKLSQVAESSDDDDDDDMDELDLDTAMGMSGAQSEEASDLKSQESAAAKKLAEKAFKKLVKLVKFQEEAKTGRKAARSAAKKMAADVVADARALSKKEKKAKEMLAKQISMDSDVSDAKGGGDGGGEGGEVAGIATIVETELGVYIPFAMALLHHVRGRYESAEDLLTDSLARLDLLNLRRPAAMGGQGSDGSSSGGGLLGALGFGGKAAIKDDPTLSYDPLRGARCEVLRAVLVQQIASAKWGSYQVRVGLHSLKASEGLTRKQNSSRRGGGGRGQAKSIFFHDNDNIRSSLNSPDSHERRGSHTGNEFVLDLEDLTPQNGPQDSPGSSGKKRGNRRRASYTLDDDDFSSGSDDEDDNDQWRSSITKSLSYNPGSNDGDGGHKGGHGGLSAAERASFVERQIQSAMVDVVECIDCFGTAVKLNPYSYDAQTGLSVAQEELRRLRNEEEEVTAIDPLLAGGDLAVRKIVLAKEQAKQHERSRHVLAAGPQDETLEINGAFVNPAWVTKFSVEFSKDKVSWHTASNVDGVRDPEMVQRLYLPPPPTPDKATGTVPPDVYEARFLRFKPHVDASLFGAAGDKKAQKRRNKGKRGAGGGGGVDGPSWQHHVSMRIGIEEYASRVADEEVVFATAAGWREEQPEEYEVKFLRRSLGIRLSEDPIKLHGDMGACPVVAVVADGKAWPRVGDLLVAVGSEPVRGTPLTLITAAIMEGRRPLTLRFFPREKWHAEIEEASYDLVYPVDQLGIQVAVNPETGLPTVISQPAAPMHVSSNPLDASKPEIEDQVVGVKKLGESTFEMLLSHADPYQRMIDLVTTGGRPITLKYLPPMARREQARLAKHSSTLENMQLRQLGILPASPGGGGDGSSSQSPAGGPGGGGPKSKPVVRVDRFEVTFTEPSLGLALQCGENEDDLPSVSSAPAGKPRPVVGDVMETVGGVPLLGGPGDDAYSKAIELITKGGRPLTIGFVALPTTTYELVFDAPRLGISLEDRGNQVPVVEANNSGRHQPSVGDRLVAINGEALEGKLDSYSWAVNKIKTGGRPLTISFKTAMEGAQAAAVLKKLAMKDKQNASARTGGGSGAPSVAIDDRSRDSTPADDRPSKLVSRWVSLDEPQGNGRGLFSQDRPPAAAAAAAAACSDLEMANFNPLSTREFGAPSVTELDASDSDENGGDGGDDCEEDGGSGLGALWHLRSATAATADARETRSRRHKRHGKAAPFSFSFDPTALHDDATGYTNGGAPASEIADADAEYKEVVFRGAKLGLDLLGGSSTGHLPVLGSPLQAESSSSSTANQRGSGGGGGLFNRSKSSRGGQVLLEVGDQLVAVGSTSLIDAEDPFDKAVELIKAHTARPVTLRFMAATTPGPFSVSFPDESLGIAIEANAADPQGFPLVFGADGAGQGGFPRVGDSVVGVGGSALGHPTDKLAEAASLIRGSPRPLRILFQPSNAEAVALAQAHHQPSSPGLDSPPPLTARVYKLSFPNKSLGIALLDQGAGQAPVVESISGSTDNTAGGNDASPQGPLRMPLAGHKLVAVNGQRVVQPSSPNASPPQPYDLAVGLIQRAPRPVELSFEPPHVYALQFPEQRLGVSLEDTSDTHGLPSILTGGCAVSPSLPLTGDVVVKVNEVEIDPSHPSESTYDQAVRLITSSPRPLTVVFAAPAVVVAAAAATAAATATTAVVQPQPSTEGEVDLDALTAAADATLSGDYGAASAAFSAGLGVTGFGSSAAESERFEVLFEGEKLGMGLEAGEEEADLPVVSSSPPGRSEPAPGDFLESVNGAMLLGHADPYSHGIDLITSSGRPLVLGFVSGAVARRPSVLAVTTVSTPTNANNGNNPLLFSAPSALALTDGTYEVVFEGEKLGMGLQAAEDPRDFPSVSSPPAGKDLPKQGHLIVSVNGYHLQGSPDTYAKAVEIITSAGRPVIIGFQDPADSSNDSFGLVGGGGSGDSLDWKQGSAGAALLANGGGVSGMEGLTPSQRVHALFDLLDTNKDGVLTKAEVIGGAPQLKMSLFDAANMFDQLDVNKDGVLERAEFVSLVPEAREEELKKMSRARRKTMQQAGEVGPLPLGLSKVLGVESDPTQQTLTPFQQQPSAAAASSSSQPKVRNQVLGPRVRPQFKASDVELFEDGSYAVTFRGGKGKGHFALPPLGFKLVEAPKKAIAPRVDLTGYAATPPTPHKDGNGKANQKLGGWPLAGHQVVAVEGAPVELDGVQDCFARCVKLVEDACNGDSRQSLSPVGCVVVTFKPLPLDEAAAAAAASEFLDDDDDDEGGGGKGTQELDLRPGLDDDEASGGEEEGQGAVTTGLWSGEDGFGTAPMEVDLEEGMYAVQFSTLDLLMKLMENVDRRQLPVVAKAFPGASLMQRGHLLMSVNGKAVDDKRSAKHEPFTTTLDLLAALQAPPVTLEFARPAPVAKISAVAGVPGLYDAVFEHENLGVDLSAFGRQGRVVRISGTHPIGVPHLGDQVVAVNGVGLLDLAERIESGKLLPQDGSKKQTKDVLSFVQRFVSGDKAVRPLTLRMQRSTGEMAAGEEAAEARRGFSVLFMSQSLGLSFDLKTGVPVVDDIRPMFTAPRQGDVLTAINGAELSKCALTVPQLALMLRALPRPVKLSFVDGSKALQDAPKATSARGEGALKYPKHHLRQVLVPAGKSVGLKLMTISSRPVVQAVLSKALVDQGLLPCDVLVTIDGKHVGDTSAVECASMLAQARQAADDETAKASRASRVKRTRAVKLGVLRMAPMDRDSSYNSQHPIDIAAALTSYDSTSKVGQLSFSLPNYIPTDKYKVEVYRYGSQVAPMMSHGSHERDHYIRYTRAVGVDLQQSGGRFAAEKKDSR